MVKKEIGADLVDVAIEKFNFDSGIWAMLSLCCKLTTPEQAKRLLERYRQFEPKYADENLGYILGYVEPPEERKRLYGLFPVSHPIFGATFGREKSSQ